MLASVPLLSEYDPGVSTEGSLDPLGLYGLADILAVRLVPGVRQRQSHPRFLTVMCAAFAVCADFDDDRIASDRVSEPWQVFEWYVVEGLIRTLSSSKELAARGRGRLVDQYPTLTKIDQLHGLPGRNKAADAIREGVPLSARRYLKNPSVFGFHGVYRTLASELGIELAGRLGEVGYELLTVWQDEQGLPGFVGSAEGDGRRWRGAFHKAVDKGLERGAVAMSSSWRGWGFIKDHLAHLNPGPREAQFLADILTRNATGFRREIMDFLSRKKAMELWAATGSEHKFHISLLEVASDELRALLEAIIAYERFVRMVQDAFDDCLLHLSLTKCKFYPKELGRIESVSLASREAPRIYPEVMEKLAPLDLAHRLEENLGTLGQAMDPADWAEALMAHHRRVQGKKPPQGKAPWVDRFDDGGYMVRQPYMRTEGGLHQDEYVHAYRTGPLFSFLLDLRV